MYYIKNKFLIDSNGSYFKTIKDEFFLTNDIVPDFDYSKYVEAVRSNFSYKVIRLYILNSDETVLRDVSEYVLTGSLTYNYQQGQTHTLNLSLDNSDNYWIPEPITGNIWNGTKFRLDIGICHDGYTYWKRCGIFVVQKVSMSGSPAKKITVNLSDKFALFDGKITGKLGADFKINVGTNLKEAIDMCVHYSDEENGVAVYDAKPVVYEKDLSGIKLPYTITKTATSTLGDIIIELANIASQDVFYNENGNLTLRPGYDAMSDDLRSIQWYYTQYDNLDYSSPEHSIDYGAIINKFTVKGNIVAGCQFKGTAINDNPKSKSNVNLNQINAETLEDKNIYSNDLALERAKYELTKKIIAYTKTSYKSIFIPHLTPKDVVMWTCPEFNIYNEKFKIQSLSFSLGEDFLLSVEMSNIKELGV